MSDDMENTTRGRMKKKSFIILMVAVCVAIAMVILLPLLLITEARRTPEETVTAYFDARFSHDVDLLLEITSPEQLKGLEEAWGENYKEDIKEALQPSIDVTFSLSCIDMQYNTDVYGENAVVEIAGGKLVTKQNSGAETVENLTIKDNLGLMGMRFVLQKIGGSWYMDVFREPTEIVIYLSDLTTEEERAAIESFLLSIPEVDPTTLYYRSKEEALEGFKERFKTQEGLWDELSGNPLPNSFVMVPKEGSSVEKILDRIENDAPCDYCIEDVNVLILHDFRS